MGIASRHSQPGGYPAIVFITTLGEARPLRRTDQAKAQALSHNALGSQMPVPGLLLALGERGNRLIKKVEDQGDDSPIAQLHFCLHPHAGP